MTLTRNRKEEKEQVVQCKHMPSRCQRLTDCEAASSRCSHDRIPTSGYRNPFNIETRKESIAQSQEKYTLFYILFLVLAAYSAFKI